MKIKIALLAEQFTCLRAVLTYAVALAPLFQSPGWAIADGPKDDFFTKQVAPIFEANCLHCHNSIETQGGFSLQSATEAMEDGFIEAGDPSGSHLLDLISPVDGRAEMPKEGNSLSSEEVATIASWIKAGAVWPDNYALQEPQVDDFDWWSLQPLRRPPVPVVEDPWATSAIDRFIAHRQEQLQLSHTAEADRRTLIRRVTYDLIGLPPTAEEVAAFVADESPMAYERLVDRLLESNQYGERWARHWLDIVKYADTHGYDKDKLRSNAWPYRDYVIRSLNEDKPYSQFVQEQIAGDVLFPGQPDGILGLGFLSAGPWDFIGHVEVPEAKIDGQVARNLDRDDMVSNVFNTFCSVTVQCARCHNHKFDAISQEHYYGLQAVFADLDRAERVYEMDPVVEQQRRSIEARLDEQQQQIVDAERQIVALGGERLTKLQRQIDSLQSAGQVRKSEAFGYHSGIAPSPEIEKSVELKLATPSHIARIVLRPCHDDFAGIGAGFGFPVRFRIELADDDGAWSTVVDRTQEDVPNPGLSPLEFPVNGVAASRVRVVATKLAERQNDYIMALAEIQILGTTADNLAEKATVHAADSIEAPIRWAMRNLIDGQWPEFDSPQAVADLADAQRQREAIMSSSGMQSLVAQRDKMVQKRLDLERELAGLPQGKVVFAAATDFPAQGNFQPTHGKPRDIFVLQRGDVQNKMQLAEPGVIPLEPGESWKLEPTQDRSQQRAGLARWITDHNHPLLWRSIVNRIWQYHFGEGLVATPNDFGRMGALPSHPELLDWLAADFREHQSFKALHRLIVNSNTYRQASTGDAGNAAIDGENRSLWRMNRRRLTAEEIRDSILAVSGCLDSSAGGPGFFLFELERTEHSPHYEYHKFDPADPTTHRRSIYRFVVRSQPDPWMTTLDCADSSQSTPKRNETLTALQALSLMNHRFNLVLAQRFAEDLERSADGLPAQVELAMQRLVQRSCDPHELEELKAYAEQHGLANLCRLLFNFSEFVFVE